MPSSGHKMKPVGERVDRERIVGFALPESSSQQLDKWVRAIELNPKTENLSRNLVAKAIVQKAMESGWDAFVEVFPGNACHPV